MKQMCNQIDTFPRMLVRFSNMENRGDSEQNQWSRFVKIMQACKMSPADLLKHPGVPFDLTSQDISQFKQDKGKRPRFNQLPWLSSAIGRDPSYLARQLGMVPEAENGLVKARIDAAHRLADLEKQAADLERIIYKRSSDVLAAIVARANETGHWAVAVWPAVEGPDDCRMHVSDRLDFSRTDGIAVTEHDLWNELGDVLELANAIRVAPQPRWAESPIPGTAWSLQTALETRAPTISMPYPDLRSVSVVSQTVTSWASDTASNIALVLGYGLDSSRAMKVKLYGGERNLVQGKKHGEDVSSLRAEIHGEYLLEPKSRTVWYHFGDGRDGKPFFPNPARPWPNGHFLVRMRESDGLLKWANRNKAKSELFLALKDRDAADLAWMSLPGPMVLSVDVDHPLGANGVKLPESERRDYRRLDALGAAVDVLEAILDRELVSPLAMNARLAGLSGTGATSNERAFGTWIKNQGRLTYRG